VTVIPLADSLLLVTHVPLKKSGERLLIDDQTALGLAQWAKHFDSITFCGILSRESEKAQPSTSWVDIAQLDFASRCKLIALPNAYSIRGMASSFHQASKLLAGEVGRHRFICCTIGGLVGDWAAMTAFRCALQRRQFSVWFDSVAPAIVRGGLDSAAFTRKMKVAVLLPLMELYHRFLLKRSRVALLQGGDTMNYYSQWAPDPQCIYDTHTTTAHEIKKDDLDRKLVRIRSREPLSLLYVGRAVDIKGPFDWLFVLKRLTDAGIPFRARWLGDGPCLEEMRKRAAAYGLGDAIELPGFVGDRDTVYAAMKSSDILLFCHKTLESPRCLIESLVSGCAIVGYGTNYPVDLVKKHGGGAFSDQHDCQSLAEIVIALNNDRQRLAEIVEQAAITGRDYNEDKVYAHRASLMRLAG
jgi:glycosyltransferase involved in cell wall biosynthesis